MGRRPYKRKIAPEMVIEGLHPEGRFWGFFSGRRVYLPDAIPGEWAEVEVTSVVRNFSKEILSAC